MIPEETMQKVCVAIERETNTITWEQAPLAVRLGSIRRCIEKESGAAEATDLAKTPPKQRKKRGPNKPKPAPLTQHAGPGQDE